MQSMNRLPNSQYGFKDSKKILSRRSSFFVIIISLLLRVFYYIKLALQHLSTNWNNKNNAQSFNKLIYNLSVIYKLTTIIKIQSNINIYLDYIFIVKVS